MSLNSLGLGFVFTAKDLASGTMRKVEGNFRRLDATSAASQKTFHKHVAGVGLGLGVAAGGALALAGAMNLADQYGGFEKGLARVGAVSRASSEDLEKLRQAAIEAGMRTQFSPQESIDALGELAVRGFTAAEAIDALGGSLDFAAGGGVEIAQGASTVASAIRVFGLQAEDATASADKLLKISNLTAISANDLELMLGNVARGAGATKQSLDEMLISMGLVKNTGVDASVAASSVSSALLAIAKNKDDFKGIGVEISNADGSFRDFIDIVMETDGVLKRTSKTQAEYAARSTELFTRFGQTAFIGISNQINNGLKDANGNVLKGAEAMAYLRTQMAQSAGAAEDFKNQMLDTLEGQKVILGGVVQTLGVVVGEMFAVVLKPIVTLISRAVSSLVSFFNMIPKPVKKMIGVFILATAAAAVIAGGILAVVSALGLAKMALVAFAGPLLIAVKALAVAVVAAAALGAAFYLLKRAYDTNIGGFGDKVRDLFGKVSLYFEAIGQLLSGDGKLRGDVLQRLLDPANEGVMNLVRTFQMAKHRVFAFLRGLQEGFASAISTVGPIFEAIGSALSELFEALGFGKGAFKAITGSSQTFVSWGDRVGHIAGEVAKILLHGLVFAIRVGTGMVNGLSLAFRILLPFGRALFVVFGAMAAVLDTLAGMFLGMTGEANKSGGSMDYLAKIVGYGLSLFILYRGAVIAAQAALLIYRGVMLAVAGVQAVFAMGAGAASLAILGPIGLVVAVGAIAYALGSYIDSLTGASDAMADWLMDITGETAAVKELGEAYSTYLKERKGVERFDSIASAAKAMGMDVDTYANLRADKIAKEQTAQDLGLDSGEIKRRLLAGEDVYQELNSAPGPEAAGAGIVASGASGQADPAKAAIDAQSDAFARALEQSAGGTQQLTKIQSTLKLDGQTLAQIMKDAKISGDALDFEAALEGM